ncbi:MAG: HD domain-containing protein [Patescibacteria group bacterium]|jgi:tRNA nucleotidyltransferase/poly(A) polymerase
MLNKIDKSIIQLAQKVTRTFPAAEVFLVGGAVRDLLLNKKIKDYDLLVRGVPAKPLEAFLRKNGKVDLVGKSFGVFKFNPKLPDPSSQFPSPIDIALPRTEYSIDRSGAYRDFKVQTNYRLKIEEDLSRRDFTVNAMALDLISGKIVDPFAGQKDLVKKIIRAVGKPSVRFAEDYSRMLRAIRFACQLDFAIEKNTWATIKKLAPKINKKNGNDFVVPRETIAKDLLKAFYAAPVLALGLFDQAGFIKQLMPELLKIKKCPQPNNWHSEGDVWQHTVLALKTLTSKRFQKLYPGYPSVNLIIGLLFHDIGKPYTIQTPEKNGSDRIRFNEHDLVGAKKAKEICDRLKLSAYKDADIDCDPDKVFWLIAKHMIAVHGRIAEMKSTTIEKYFFIAPAGQDLIKLIHADEMATVPAKGEKFISYSAALRRRIAVLAKLAKNKKTLPAPILDGNEIIKILKIKPGPHVGRAIAKLREEQLRGRVKTKQQAMKFIKKLTS